MITASISGGLGNQMFIIATIYTHAQQHGHRVRFILDYRHHSLLQKRFFVRLLPFPRSQLASPQVISSASKPPVSSPIAQDTRSLGKRVLYDLLRSTLYDIARIARAVERRVINKLIDLRIYHVLSLIFDLTERWNTEEHKGGKNYYRYRHFYNTKSIVSASINVQQKKVFSVKNAWDYVALPIQDKIHFIGCFQNLHYFSHNRRNLEKLFLFNHTRAWQFLKEHNLDPKNIVTVHVRRGDYITTHLHADPTSKEYIEEALSHFPGKRPLFVAQDRQWVQEHFPRELCSDLPHDWDDMGLMTLAHNHIIWASSFSWWGAWLANKKQVVAPRHWDRVDNTDVVSALLPPEWTVLEY